MWAQLWLLSSFRWQVRALLFLQQAPKEDPAKGGTFGSFSTYSQLQPKAMSNAMDWAEKVASNPKWAHIDISRVAAAGQSCGGHAGVYG